MLKWWRKRQRDDWVNTRPVATGKANVGGEPLPLKLQTEPIIGNRYWRITADRKDGGLALQSIHVTLIWEKEVTAECRSEGYKYGHGKHEDPPPSLECACGLYAQLPDMPITEWLFAIGGKVFASGEVALSGRVIKCSRGFKAERAEILSPIYLDATCMKHANRCPQPIEFIAPPEKGITHYHAYCDEHRDDELPLIDADVWFPEAARQLSDRYDLEVLHWR